MSERVIEFRGEGKQLISVLNEIGSVEQKIAKDTISNNLAAGKSFDEVVKTLEKELELRNKVSAFGTRAEKAEARDKFNRAKDAHDPQRMWEAEQQLTELGVRGTKETVVSGIFKEMLRILKDSNGDQKKLMEAMKRLGVDSKMFKEMNLDDLSEKLAAEKAAEAKGEAKEDKKDDKGNRTWDVFKGVAAANMLQGFTAALGRMGGARDSEHSINALISGINPFGIGIGALIGSMRDRHLDELQALEDSQFAFQGTTNTKDKVRGGYGYKTADVYARAVSLARARGSKGISEATEDMLSAGRAFNLDDNTMTGLARGERYGGRGIMNNVSQAVQILGGINAEMTKLPDILSTWTALQQQQLSATGKVDDKQIVKTIRAAQFLGGRFAIDPSLMTGLSDALANPSSEYQQARSFATLSKLNKKGSVLDILKQQQLGLAAPGYMTGVMSDITSKYGTGDRAELALYSALGGKFSRADIATMMKGFKADKNMWDKPVSEENMREKIRELGGQKVGSITGEQAVSSDEFAVGAWEGFTGNLSRSAKKIADGFDGVTEKLMKFSASLAGVDLDQFTNKKSKPNSKPK